MSTTVRVVIVDPDATLAGDYVALDALAGFAAQDARLWITRCLAD